MKFICYTFFRHLLEVCLNKIAREFVSELFLF
nr:MAG TPA: hypothetical protein [Bacteriophage sp.]